LVAALEWLARQTHESAGVPVEVEAAFDADVAPTSAAALYRVAQEALRNAVTHSGASSIRIWITGDRTSVTLEVVDDGVGFDVDAAEARRPGMGLFSIRERVALVGGTVEIHSGRGRGTRVTATVPLAPQEV
jgi:signal transduction histidine kinase